MEITEKVYTYKNDWTPFIEARESGATLAIDEEMFYYWLEVLPPVYMNKDVNINGAVRRCDFGFAEGCEPITDFWRTKVDGVELFCCRLRK